MALDSISQSLKNCFEDCILGFFSSKPALLMTGLAVAEQLYHKSLIGTLVTGAVFATCLHARKWVTCDNVIDRLQQLDKDLRTAIRKGDFSAKKVLFIDRYNAIRNVFDANKNQNHRIKMNWQKAVRELKTVYQLIQRAKTTFLIPRARNPLPRLFSAQAQNERIFSFLGVEEIARTGAVSSSWNQSINTLAQWRQHCASLIPGSIPAQDLSSARTNAAKPATDYLQQIKDFCPKIIGREFYQKHYGVDVGPVPPIPPQLLEKADSVIFVPEYFSMTIPENSPLGLDQNGRLTENPDEYVNRPQAIDGKRVLQVSFTLNNHAFLSKMFFKSDIFRANREILDQYGDTRYPAHWSGQKRALIGKGLSYAQQQLQAQQTKMKIVPLLDRILFNVCNYLQEGVFVDDAEMSETRTATVVLDRNNNPQHALICHSFLDDQLFLSLGIGGGYRIGAAVEVSDGKVAL